jgi:two-component system, NtrC family, sensor histidine kinase HydH
MTTVEEIQQEELAGLFAGFARMRVILAPIPMSVCIYIAVVDPSWWRRALMATLLVLIPTLIGSELWRFKAQGMRPIRYRRTLTIIGVAMMMMAAATGGVESPFVAAVIPMTIVLGAILTRPAHRVAVFAFFAAAIWTMTLIATGSRVAHFVPLPFGGGPRAGHNDVLLLFQATMASMMLIGLFYFSRLIRLRFDALVQRAGAARAEALQAHADQLQLLTALSAEIAHELKNPLASVKGLAALMAPELEGKNGERITVLRREVERMQTILEELLNFTRPLGPLTRQEADLAELCRSVADLHEGMCREAGVSVKVRAGGRVNAPCDARKVKQILINLLQNAIEASPPGRVIDLEVEKGTIRVLDRGGGLLPSVAERVFEPGATTKPTGSGLGLTVARALARQHGGELSLSARPDGGCAAELRLPS